MSRTKESEYRGARLAEPKFTDIWRSYYQHHLSSAQTSLIKMLATPLASLMTWLVIAIALALPAVMSLALINVDQLGSRWEGRANISVYLHKGVKPASLKLVQDRARLEGLIVGMEYISPEQGLADFSGYSGFGDVLSGLDGNPIPGMLQLELKPGLSRLEVDKFQSQLAELPQVQQVAVDLVWLQRLHQIMSLGQRMVLILAGLLALGVLLITGNTIRLAIAARKEEIIVTKLLGGTNGFIRRPFLYSGLWFGLGGGLLAVLLCQLALWLLSGSIAALLVSYESEYQLTGLGFYNSLLLLGAAAFLGWLGAFLAVARHLSEAEPS